MGVTEELVDIYKEDVAVILTHSYAQDSALLQRLLPKALRYLGILGPLHRTHRLSIDLGPIDARGCIRPIVGSRGGDVLRKALWRTRNKYVRVQPFTAYNPSRRDEYKDGRKT